MVKTNMARGISMTDALLALVPTYGIWLILLALPLSCLALPVPSSILVMTAGGFAAAGDLTLWQVQAAAFAGFVAGDQVTYGIARAGGAPLVARMKARPKLGPLFARAEAMLNRRGTLAVFLSRTIFSPLGPYMGYLSGALRLHWAAFSLAAVLGAVCWPLGYSLLGYVFATQITQVASLIGNAIGVIMAGAAARGLIWYLVRSWKAEQAKGAV
jgi:membrane protein DedA with SNARE-associated domain